MEDLEHSSRSEKVGGARPATQNDSGKGSNKEHLQSLMTDIAVQIEGLQAGQRGLILESFQRLREYLISQNLPDDHELASEAMDVFDANFTAGRCGLAVITVPDLIIRHANAAYRAPISNTDCDPTGCSIRDVWPCNSVEDQEAFEKLLTSQQVLSGNFPYRHPDGTKHSITIYVAPVAWHGQPAVLLVSWETTRLEAALHEVEQRERLLRQSEARYRQLLETAYEGIWTTDEQDNIDFVNERGLQILGYSAEEMLGRPALNFHLPGDLSHAAHNLEETKRGQRGTSEYQIRHKSGEVVWISSSTSPILDEQGNYSGSLAVFTDITEQKQAEHTLGSLEVQRRLLEHRERERQEIARDIHDGPVQSLVGLLFSLKAARENTQSPAYLKLLEQVTGGIREVVQELREVVNELRPPALLNYGLSRAIQIHTEDLRARQLDLKIDLDLVEDENLLPEEMCLALYRIYQEGINNVVRHARASQVWVRYYPTRAHMVLEVRDNGCGFVVPADWVDYTRNNHFGVAGMRERAEAVGGLLIITSQPNQGTILQVKVPLP